MPHGRKLLAVLATALPMLLPAAAGAATINVDIRTDEFNSDGECSLREAVDSANQDSAVLQNEPGCETGGGNDTVRLTAGDPYTLTTDIDGIPGINDGDLEVTDTDGTTFLGDDRTTTVIDGGDEDRVLDVTTGTGTVVVNSITVQNGQTLGGNGGGIETATNVSLQNARVTGNFAAGASGGGIAANANGISVTLTDSSVDTNQATNTGGGVSLFSGASLTASGGSAINGNTAGLQGGGINNGGAGDITLNTGVTVNGNNGGGVGGGVAMNSGLPSSDVTVSGATVNGNSISSGVSATGGGIHFVGGGGQLQLTDAKVQSNTATGTTGTGVGVLAAVGSGTLAVTRSLVSGNTLTITDNMSNGNVHSGGGMSISGAGLATITDSRIVGNAVTVQDPEDFGSGGGINDAGSMRLVASTVDGNSATGGLAQTGGGLSVAQTATGPAMVLNSTFSGNTVGGELNSAGGAINAGSVPVAVTIAQSTFEGNSAPTGASLALSGSTYTVRGSVFSDGATACAPNTLSGVNGYNVDEGTSCVGTTDDTDLESTAATLGPLQENGGPLYGMAGPALTHALTGPAGALNLVPSADCEDLDGFDLTVDQRGAPRPTDGGCEPGAYELISCLGAAAFVGSDGDDTINAVGFPAHEAFHGLDGADTITGDAGLNRLCGGDGGDTILARDGAADQIDCGPGTDTAQTDPLAIDTVTGCESVDTGEQTNPPPSGNPTPPPPATGVTGQRARAIKKCKKKFPKGPKRKKCIKKAKRLPV